jgi:hypothetical protein
MCDFNAVRNWLIAATVALGGAISSVIFGLVFPLWASGAFWAAVGWCALTIGLILGASAALDGFCKCASGSSLCGQPCAMLRTLMTALNIAMSVAALLAGRAALQGWSPWFAGLFLVDAFIVLGIAGAVAANLVNLGSCVARSTSPPRPAPAGGTGVGTSGTAPI